MRGNVEPAVNGGGGPDLRSWGIGSRKNNWVVRLLLWVLQRRASRLRELNTVRRKIRDTLCFALSSDIRSHSIAPGLFLPHPYGIVVHARARVGRNCTLYQNVTLGEDGTRAGVPELGDDVIVGAGAAILGPVHVGSGARIGANSVVLADVPDGATVVGVPGRVLRRR